MSRLLVVTLILASFLGDLESLSDGGNQAFSPSNVDTAIADAKAKSGCHFKLVVEKVSDNYEQNLMAVTFTVTIDNNRTDPPRHFILVRDPRAMFLLALPDDSEIMSLATLKRGVGRSNIKMKPADNNNGSYDDLSAICKEKVIVATLYNTPQSHVQPGQPVCFPPLNTENNTDGTNVVHLCCSWRENMNLGFVNCTEVIYPNKWVAFGIIAIQVMSVIIIIIAPLLFKYLPTRDVQVRHRQRGAGQPRRLGYSNHLVMPVNANSSNKRLLTLSEPLSFVTFGGDNAQAWLSRICRALGVLIFPLIFCLIVYVFFLKNHNAEIRTNISYYTGLVATFKPPVDYYVFMIALFCIIWLSIWVIIPNRLSALGKSLCGRKDERTFLGFQKPDSLINHQSGKTGFQFMQSNMVFHMKCCFECSFWLLILKVLFSPCVWLASNCFPDDNNPGRQSPEEQEDVKLPKFFLILGFIVLPLLMAVWMPFVVFCLFVYVTPTGYVAFRICRLLYSQDIPINCNCCERLPCLVRSFLVTLCCFVFVLFCTSILASYVFLIFMFGVFCYILLKIFLFTLIGLGFHVDYYIPFVVVALFVVFYIWMALSRYVFVYENLRIVVFEECEKYEQHERINVERRQEAPGAANDTGENATAAQTSGLGLLLLDENNSPSIPLGLYVSVYRRLKPRAKTFFTIFIKLLLVLVYISIAFASIMSLDYAEGTSSYVQAAFLCALLALPLVFSHGCSASQSRRSRKSLEYQVRFIVHRYVLMLENNQERGRVPGEENSSAAESPENNMFEV